MNRPFRNTLIYFVFMTILSHDCKGYRLTYRFEKVTMSSQYKDWVGSRAIDGNHKTDADGCNCCAGTNTDTDPSLTIDRGVTSAVAHVIVHGRTDGGPVYRNLNGLEVLLDGRPVNSVPTTEHVSYYNFDFSEKAYSARNITFVLRGHDRILTICEVDIYKENIISINKDAKISSGYYDWEASRAVDGDFHTNPAQCGCCASSDYQRDPWLSVDLGRVYKLSRIVVYGRSEGQYSGQNFEGMTIHLDSVRVETLAQCNTWIDFYDIDLEPAVFARQVTIQLTGTHAQLVVCAIAVAGTLCDCDGQPCNKTTGVCQCKPGHTGEKCTQVCPDNRFGQNCASQCYCEGRTCNSSTGICPSGLCKPGYTGDTCSQVCSDDRFGQNCASQCYCEGRTCNSSTGICPSGLCKPGYTGDTCSQDCLNGTRDWCEVLQRYETSISITVYVLSLLAVIVIEGVVVLLPCAIVLKRRNQSKTMDAGKTGDNKQMSSSSSSSSSTPLLSERKES